MKANVHLAVPLLALGLWLAPSVVEASIGLRGVAQAGTTTTTLTIAKPTGTVQNDVMVASIAFRPLSGQFSSNITVTDPPGWTRLDFFNNTSNFATHKFETVNKRQGCFCFKTFRKNKLLLF